MLLPLLLPEIHELILQKDWRALKEMLATWPAPDLADLLETLSVEDALLLFRMLSTEAAAEAFGEMVPERQEALLRSMSDQRVRDIVLELSPDDRTELFEDLPPGLTQRLMNLLPPEERKQALELLGYPENSVGRLMTPDFIALRPEWTVGKAIEHIRAQGRDAETIDMVYAVDEAGRLLDDIPIRRFVLAERARTVQELMDGSFVSLLATADQEEAARQMKHYNLVALPVTNQAGALLGIVTFDDIFEVIEEEATEDFQKGSAVQPLDTSYTAASPWKLYRKRIIWLLVLLVADFFSSGIIAHFEKALQAVIALAFYIPVLIDTGGNTASQSATLVTRALATGELTVRRWFTVIGKEMVTGILIGVTLGVVCFVRGALGRGGTPVGLVIGLSITALTIWTNILGGLLPIACTKLKFDPAVVSSPLLTTVADATGLLIYFGIATLILF